MGMNASSTIYSDNDLTPPTRINSIVAAHDRDNYTRRLYTLKGNPFEESFTPVWVDLDRIAYHWDQLIDVVIMFRGESELGQLYIEGGMLHD